MRCLPRDSSASAVEASPAGRGVGYSCVTAGSAANLREGSRSGRVAGEKLKVLYVMGPGRSGSTVLGQILNGVDGFFLVGELYYLWDRGLIENRLCSCGALFKRCPVWEKVLRESFGGAERIDAERVIDLRGQALGNRRLLFSTAKHRRRAVLRMGEYLGALEALYRGVALASESRVIVDTSKSPAYGFALENVQGIEVYVLHLVRDPRAIAYSWWDRKKRQPASEKRPGRYMTARNPLETSLTWSVWNLAVEKTWSDASARYMLLRYEDFVQNPRRCLERVMAFVGEEGTLPLVEEREVSLGVNHAFSGNPDRLRSGSVILREDEEWKHRMGRAQHALVAATTWPGLLKYGYHVFGRR